MTAQTKTTITAPEIDGNGGVVAAARGFREKAALRYYVSGPFGQTDNG